jgi:hypothetical protein
LGAKNKNPGAKRKRKKEKKKKRVWVWALTHWPNPILLGFWTIRPRTCWAKYPAHPRPKPNLLWTPESPSLHRIHGESDQILRRIKWDFSKLSLFNLSFV